MQPPITGIKRSRESENESISQKKPRIETQQRRTCLAGLRDASFAFLTEDLMFRVFEHVPVEDLGRLATASHAMSKLVLSYLVSDSYAERAALLLDDLECDTLEVCRELGRALKRATFLYPVSVRLQYLHQFLGKLRAQLTLLEQEHPGYLAPLNAFKCVGEILSVFIAGWDDEECCRVFKSFCLQYNISHLLARFVHDEPGKDVKNELLLRGHLRDLFLDPCSTDVERATWFGFISQRLGTAQLAKLVLLLYGPLDDQGQLDWMFAFKLRSFEVYTTTYMRLGRMIGSLQHIPDWTKQSSLEVLVYMSNIPHCWLLRSFASILLPLSAYNKNLVFDYFSVLLKSGRTSTATLLMALVLMISPHYINHSQARLEESLETSDDDDDHANEALLDSKSAYRFVSDIINNTQLSDQRHFVKTKMWDTIFDLANDFAEASIQEDDPERISESQEDFRALMEALKDYMIFAMID